MIISIVEYTSHLFIFQLYLPVCFLSSVVIHCTDLVDDCDSHDDDDNHGGDGDGCVRGGDGDDGGDNDDHVDGGGGDPLHGPLSVLGGDVRVDALVAKVRDDRPQERLRLLHVVERR